MAYKHLFLFVLGAALGCTSSADDIADVAKAPAALVDKAHKSKWTRPEDETAAALDKVRRNKWAASTAAALDKVRRNRWAASADELVKTLNPQAVPTLSEDTWQAWLKETNGLMFAGMDDHWWTWEHNKHLLNVSQDECNKLRAFHIFFPTLHSLDAYPLPINVHENIPRRFHNEIRLAVDTWNSAAGRELIQIKKWHHNGWPPIKTLKYGNAFDHTRVNINRALVSLLTLNSNHMKSPPPSGMVTIEGNVTILDPSLTSLDELQHEVLEIGFPHVTSSPVFYSVVLHELGHILHIDHIEPEHGGLTMASMPKMVYSKNRLSLTEVKIARCLALK